MRVPAAYYRYCRCCRTINACFRFFLFRLILIDWLTAEHIGDSLRALACGCWGVADPSSTAMPTPPHGLWIVPLADWNRRNATATAP